MTSKTATLSAQAPQGGFVAALSGMIEEIRRGWSERRTNLLLADLDDHTLDDIGLHPSQVRRTRQGLTDWVIQTQSGTSRIVFIGR
jgi:uncharacterized protein YjiS (DUF1127 family)